MGLGVPVAPSFLDLDDGEDEETVTYDPRGPGRQSDSSLVSLSDADIEIVPTTKSDVVESNIHRFAANQITDDLAPPESNARVSSYAKVPSRPIPVPSSNQRERVSASAFLTKPQMAPSETRNRHLRVRVSNEPPQSAPPVVVRPGPSPTRSFFAKLLFLAILTVVLMLVATEVSIARNVPWLDPRPFLVKLWKLVAQTIPWDRLPKLPTF